MDPIFTPFVELAPWTTEQQKAFEKALKSHPGTMPAKERWIGIIYFIVTIG